MTSDPKVPMTDAEVDAIIAADQPTVVEDRTLNYWQTERLMRWAKSRGPHDGIFLELRRCSFEFHPEGYDLWEKRLREEATELDMETW
jgi:hypothetical protein